MDVRGREGEGAVKYSHAHARETSNDLNETQRQPQESRDLKPKVIKREPAA